MLKIYNSHVQIEAVPNWSPYLTSTPADTVSCREKSVDPVICHGIRRILAQNAVTQPLHDSSNILIIYQDL